MTIGIKDWLLILCLLPGTTGTALANDISLPGLEPVKRAAWNETSVRKVLHALAYGAQATDEQIERWAAMGPARAIQQMLTFEPHNKRLSPPDKADSNREPKLAGTLASLSDFWASDHRLNRTPDELRQYYAIDAWGGPRSTWLQAARVRGLNPFRERVGFFETNVHMAVNQASGVSTWQLVRYYDTIMSALEAGLPYHQVIARAASSAAVAHQYGHDENWWYDNTCYCNEDFAREIHQLFFGILGVDDPEYHETVTIKNTAKALTGMPLAARDAPDDWAGAYVDFQTRGHHRGPLRILGEKVIGRTAKEKILAIAKIAIHHPESLDNLPVIIIAGLADDNLTEQKRGRLRQAWRSMQRKDLLRFLRAYAISDVFHDSDRIKYHTSIERHLLAANLIGLNNAEHFRDLAEDWRLEWAENSRPFEPEHNVFGAQTGIEAANSALVFRINYNNATESGYRFQEPVIQYPSMSPKEKDWGAKIPRSTNGYYRVRDVARWLWQRLLADGHKQYGRLERAHLHALLANGKHLSAIADPDHPGKVISATALAPGTPLAGLVTRLGKKNIALGSTNPQFRQKANRRVGQAVNFILATPFALAQEGR